MLWVHILPSLSVSLFLVFPAKRPENASSGKCGLTILVRSDDYETNIGITISKLEIHTHASPSGSKHGPKVKTNHKTMKIGRVNYTLINTRATHIYYASI